MTKGREKMEIFIFIIYLRYVVDQELTNIAVDVIKEASRSVNQKINNPVFILSLALKDEKAELCKVVSIHKGGEGYNVQIPI